MMTNKLIANKIKDNNFKNIISLSEQTKNLLPQKNPNNDKILLKIKLKSPIRRVNLSMLRKNKTKEINNLSKMRLPYEIDNYKNNIGIINYNLVQPNNYLIHSNKLINNISKLNKSYNDKSKILPEINNYKHKNKSIIQTNEKLDLSLKKISLGDLSKNNEEKEENGEVIKTDNKLNLDKNKFDDVKINSINKSYNSNKIKKLLLMRNSTNYKLDNDIKIKSNTSKTNRNAKLLKKYYQQKMLNYDRLIKKMEEESEIKKNIMKEYINLMKENFENGF